MLLVLAMIKRGRRIETPACLNAMRTIAGLSPRCLKRKREVNGTPIYGNFPTINLDQFGVQLIFAAPLASMFVLYRFALVFTRVRPLKRQVNMKQIACEA